MVDQSDSVAKRKRLSRDDHYINALCDGVLDEKEIRMYNKFDQLSGDIARDMQVDAH